MRFMDGNEAIARAAIEADCRFFAGYRDSARRDA
jgi:pyruvate/2-oxoacid:ferredoxin oxidoreductase alpha subunit